MSSYSKVKLRLQRMSALRRRVVAAGISFGVLAATGGVALAVTAGEPSPGGPVPPLSETAQAQSIEPGVQASFGLLRRAQTPTDIIPASVPVTFSQSSGANVDLARRVKGSQGDEAWVVPGKDSLCILAQQTEDHIGGAVCVPSSGAKVGQLSVQSASGRLPGSELIAGVMPDGVSSVTLDLSGGATSTVPVDENVYMDLVHGAVTSMKATGANGPLVVEGLSASSSSSRFAR